MSRFCPIQNENVVYLTCLECEDKVCLLPHVNPNEINDGENKEIKHINIEVHKLNVAARE